MELLKLRQSVRELEERDQEWVNTDNDAIPSPSLPRIKTAAQLNAERAAHTDGHHTPNLSQQRKSAVQYDVCYNCDLQIRSGGKILALGKHYHEDCFSCARCGKLFNGSRYWEENGKPVHDEVTPGVCKI